MMMKKYTEKDLKVFERNEWEWLICPSGDYTAIGTFPEKCIFGKGCNFGRRSNFGVMCGFGDGCTFGEMCGFGAWCTFGEASYFGQECSFGEGCSFGELCSHEGLTNSIYVAVDRIGSGLQKTYFFKAEEGYFVRAGWFFGTIDEFKEQVHKTHFGTIHETTYLMACELAVKLLDEQYEEVK